MRWMPFQYDGTEYDLQHLHPRTVVYTQPEKGANPPRNYTVDVIFSLHCFTRGLENENSDPGLLYSDSRETRIFDLRRYELSKRLPGIIANLTICKCFHTGRGNFFTIKILDDICVPVEYEIYFTASKSPKAGIVNLYVQSAYARDVSHRGNRPRMKPISFSVILYNTLHKIPIIVPK